MTANDMYRGFLGKYVVIDTDKPVNPQYRGELAEVNEKYLCLKQGVNIPYELLIGVITSNIWIRLGLSNPDKVFAELEKTEFLKKFGTDCNISLDRIVAISLMKEQKLH